MEKKDYYTLREILLGLHVDYLDNQQQLQQLKQYCEMDDKRATDFNFRVFKPENMKPILLCDFEPKQNKMQKIVAEINKKTGRFSYPNETANLVRDNNRYYFLYKNGEFPIYLKSDYGIDSEFGYLVDSILDSKFSNGIDSKYITNNLSGLNAALTIDSSSIEFYVKDDSGNVPRSVLLYDALTDGVDFYALGVKPTKEQFETVMNVKIPSEELNEYHVDRILKDKEKPLTLKKTKN